MDEKAYIVYTYNAGDCHAYGPLTLARANTLATNFLQGQGVPKTLDTMVLPLEAPPA